MAMMAQSIVTTYTMTNILQEKRQDKRQGFANKFGPWKGHAFRFSCGSLFHSVSPESDLTNSVSFGWLLVTNQNAAKKWVFRYDDIHRNNLLLQLHDQYHSKEKAG